MAGRVRSTVILMRTIIRGKKGRPYDREVMAFLRTARLYVLLNLPLSFLKFFF